MSALHQRIKLARLNRRLSQAALAEKTGVSQPTVANWETGSHTPRPNALSQISHVLEVTTQWLLTGDDGADSRPIQNYLSQPIRHVPIHNWPGQGQTIFDIPPVGYIPYPAQEEHTFALLAEAPDNSQQRVMIFEPSANRDDPQSSGQDKRYLWTDGKTTRVDKADKLPTDGRILGSLKTDITSY